MQSQFREHLKSGNLIAAKDLVTYGSVPYEEAYEIIFQTIPVQKLEGLFRVFWPHYLAAFACKTGNFEVAKYLRDLGVRLSAPTILHDAIVGGNMEMIEFINPGEPEEPHNSAFLVAAVTSGKLEVVKYVYHWYCKHGIQVEKIWVRRAIDTASRFGHIEIIFFLFRIFANPTQSEMQDIAMTACANGHAPLVSALLDRTKYDMKTDPLKLVDSAIACQRHEVVKLFIDRGLELGDRYPNM